MVLELPLPKKISTNKIYAGIHWATRKKQADLFHKSLMEFRGKKVEEYPVNINYIFEFKGKLLDTTNCTYMAKLIEDSLVINGIIEDDSPKFVEFTGIYSQKGEKDKVTIYIS